jgi:carbohydrate diacid regulator
MDPTSIDAGTAAAFIRRLGEHLEYNINIMDRHGVIIASRDPARIGSFHDAAQRLVATGADQEVVEDRPSLPAGVRPGVNLPIVSKGETVGVVGVTGDPVEVGPLAWAIKTSVESMIELEAWKDKALRRQDSKNTLVNYLLHEDNAPRSAVEALAAKLGYNPRLHRAPLLLVPGPGVESAEALRAAKASPLHGSEDLSWATPEGSVLVFKSLSFGKGSILADYTSQLEAYVQQARRGLGKAGEGLAAYAGAFQTDLGRYGLAYRQTLWLREHVTEPGKDLVSIFDHLFDFFVGLIPRAELVGALDATADLLPADVAASMRLWVDALSASGLNGKEAAARLGVHRNTFSARMEGLSRLVGRDPRRDTKALEFLSILGRYLGTRR